MLTKLVKFLKAQPVLVIAFLAAAATMLIVPPDREYLTYCSRSVLIQLFCLMLSVSGLRSVGVFEKATACLLCRTGNLRRLGIIFMLVCFFCSMLLTNDVALITFVPLTLLVYEHIGDEKSRIFTIVLETAAANLGSMMTPFGNPQNLYIYDRYRLHAADFFLTMLPSGAVSLGVLLLLCLFLPKDPCKPQSADSGEISVDKRRSLIYIAMFAVSLLTVFRLLPDYICLAAALVTALAANRRLLLKVDYALLATFVCFFVFVGNVARIAAVSELLSQVLGGRELIISAALSQVISNVPAAIMLSGFTENGRELLLGVNIGGLGTPVASLASLISLQFYKASEGAKPARYLAVFSLINFAMLILLIAVAFCTK